MLCSPCRTMLPQRSEPRLGRSSSRSTPTELGRFLLLQQGLVGWLRHRDCLGWELTQRWCLQGDFIGQGISGGYPGGYCFRSLYKKNTGGRGDDCTTKINVRCPRSALKSQEASHVIFKNHFHLCLSFSYWKIKTVAALKYGRLGVFRHLSFSCMKMRNS